jgi:ParB/RepB/Spo0J family partition protein
LIAEMADEPNRRCWRRLAGLIASVRKSIMASKKSGFGASVRNRTVRHSWGSEKSETNAKSKNLSAEPSYDVHDIKIADIKVKGRRRALNPNKLTELVDSISSLGLQSPITVRLVKRMIGWGKTKTERHLVIGLHRLEAMKQLGKTTIPCFILEGDKRDARMREISENLHRADLTQAEYDEQVAEWVRMFQEAQSISGQNGQKIGRGRRKGGYSEAARKLPVKGKTHAAKRKRIALAVKAASIFPEAKKAAGKAGLHSRSARLKIAAEETADAQLAKVDELAKQKKTRKLVSLSTASKKILEDLMKHWNNAEDVKQPFIEAPREVVEQFIIKIRRDWSRGQVQGNTRSNWV